MRVCTRCGHVQYPHRWRESVRQLADPPVCHRYEPPAPWWLRLLNRGLARADRLLGGPDGE